MDGASNWQSKSRTIRETIKTLFRNAATALIRRGQDEPKPEPRRKSGETEKEGFDKAAAALMRRAPGDVYATARVWLADTLEWLNLWQDNAEAANLNEFDSEFENSDTNFPTLNL